MPIVAQLLKRPPPPSAWERLLEKELSRASKGYLKLASYDLYDNKRRIEIVAIDKLGKQFVCNGMLKNKSSLSYASDDAVSEIADYAAKKLLAMRESWYGFEI